MALNVADLKKWNNKWGIFMHPFSSICVSFWWQMSLLNISLNFNHRMIFWTEKERLQTQFALGFWANCGVAFEWGSVFES